MKEDAIEISYYGSNVIKYELDTNSGEIKEILP